MASENVTAFQLYFMDNINDFKTRSNTINDAYDNAKKEWDKLPKDITSFYIKKEMSLNKDPLNTFHFPHHRLQFISHFFNNSNEA